MGRFGDYKIEKEPSTWDKISKAFQYTGAGLAQMGGDPNPAARLNQYSQNEERMQMQQEKQALQNELLLAKIAGMAGGGGKPKPTTKGQEAADRKFGQDYAEYAGAGGYTTLRQQLDRLDDVVNDLESGKVTTGAIKGAVAKSETAGGALGSIFTPKLKDMVQTVRSTVAPTLRPILGAQFTQKDREVLEALAFDPTLPAEMNIKRIKQQKAYLSKRLEEKEKTVRYWEDNGGTLAGYKASLELPEKEMAQNTQGQAGGFLKGIKNQAGRALHDIAVPSAGASEPTNYDSMSDDELYKLYKQKKGL